MEKKIDPDFRKIQKYFRNFVAEEKNAKVF